MRTIDRFYSPYCDNAKDHYRVRNEQPGRPSVEEMRSRYEGMGLFMDASRRRGGPVPRAVVSDRGELFESASDAAQTLTGNERRAAQVYVAVRGMCRFHGRRWKYATDPRGWDELPQTRQYRQRTVAA